MFRMERAELFEAWQQRKDSAQWVRAHRDEIHEHVDVSEPIPTGGTAAVTDWLARFKGTVTEQLDDGTEGDE